MDKKKLIILILVVIGVLTIMMFGAGAYRSKNDRPPKDDGEPHWFAKGVGGATGWLKPKFEIKRMKGACRSGETLRFTGTCEVKVMPGSSRPSSFKLRPVSGVVELCYAFSRAKLAECVLGVKEPKLRKMKYEDAGFTVAKDTAFLYLRCAATGSSQCVVNIKKD